MTRVRGFESRDAAPLADLFRRSVDILRQAARHGPGRARAMSVGGGEALIEEASKAPEQGP